MACIFLSISAVKVHDSQAYRKMGVTRERISRILELREILMSIQTGFSLVNAAVVCAILESISGLEPSSVITEPRYFKLVTISSYIVTNWAIPDSVGIVTNWATADSVGIVTNWVTLDSVGIVTNRATPDSVGIVTNWATPDSLGPVL